jgi:2-octaprenyl-6-methoxyphenol hydroxylase
LVIADGGGNVGEFLAGTVSESFDYYQIAVLATVHATHLRAGFAFERFTPEGPIALLPFEDGMALVWTTTQERAHALLPMPEQEFLDELQRHFGDRLGKFTRAGRRSVFPLSRRQVRVDAQRVALIGNAAQTLHPVAGQGFNLGLRDAWELAQLIKQRSEDAAAALKHYAAQRARDRRSAIGFTDSLICAFSNNRPLLGLARGSGLAMLDFVAPLRRSFARRMAFGIRSGQ